MKILLLFGCLGLILNTALAGELPRGSLLELHSCEVYAGGCVVSSEATQGGRYMLRVWDFAAGDFNRADFKGLQVAVLQVSPDNLAATDGRSGQAVVYLPQAATQPQRDALLAWLKASQKDFQPEKLRTRIVPLHFTKSASGCAFAAGDLISVKTGQMHCESDACGQTLWYEPRTTTSLFTVAVDRASRISEPLLKLTWIDAGKRSVFLAHFGEPESARDVYVTLGELCGPAGNLF